MTCHRCTARPPSWRDRPKGRARPTRSQRATPRCFVTSRAFAAARKRDTARTTTASFPEGRRKDRSPGTPTVWAEVFVSTSPGRRCTSTPRGRRSARSGPPSRLAMGAAPRDGRRRQRCPSDRGPAPYGLHPRVALPLADAVLRPADGRGPRRGAAPGPPHRAGPDRWRPPRTRPGLRHGHAPRAAQEAPPWHHRSRPWTPIPRFSGSRRKRRPPQGST